jgi:hypothetical protein
MVAPGKIEQHNVSENARLRLLGFRLIDWAREPAMYMLTPLGSLLIHQMDFGIEGTPWKRWMGIGKPQMGDVVVIDVDGMDDCYARITEVDHNGDTWYVFTDKDGQMKDLDDKEWRINWSDTRVREWEDPIRHWWLRASYELHHLPSKHLPHLLDN